MFKSLNTERSRRVFLGRRRPLSSAFCDSSQTFSGAGRLFSSALPCQTLHEATGNCRDDDDAHEQSGGHPDDQGDEEQVSNWRGKPERQVEGLRDKRCCDLCLYQLIFYIWDSAISKNNFPKSQMLQYFACRPAVSYPHSSC